MAEMVMVYNNGGYEVLGSHTLRHAIRMIHRGVARVLEAVEGEKFGPYAKPRSVELVRYIYVAWKRSRHRHVSKRGVLERDHYTCAYCGKTGHTVDHIKPKSKGGRSTWMNLVTACSPCNERKDNLSLRASGMALLYQPFVPEGCIA